MVLDVYIHIKQKGSDTQEEIKAICFKFRNYLSTFFFI